MSMMTPLARLFGLAKDGVAVRPGGGVGSMLILLALTVALFMATTATAATPPDFEAEDAFNLFGSDIGDPFTSVFLNQLFGPLFPTGTGAETETVFSAIIGYFNVIVLVIGGGLFFWNITVGTLQSAHEGSVLGQRWSSLWAPIRTIFAIGLIIPVPNLGGYNIAQSSVAYVVRGSTMMASEVWSRSARLVIDGEVAIAGSPPTIEPGVMKQLYLNAACESIVTYQLQQAAGDGNTPLQVVWEPADIPSFGSSLPLVEGQTMLGMVSAVRSPDGTVSRQEICGTYASPKLPQYVDQISDGSTQAVPTIVDADRTRIKNLFQQAHVDSLDAVRADMAGIVARLMPIAQQAGAPMPNIAADVSASLRAANEALDDDMDAIMDIAIGVDREGQVARDALLARITGNCSDSISGAEGAEPTRCYSEGWIGAGSWYMMMAQLNNELASLTNARSSATEGDYIQNIDGQARDLVIASGGDVNSGIYDFFAGTDYRAQTGMMSQQEATLLMAKFEDAWENSVAQLAALGFPMSKENLANLNREVANPDSAFISIPGLAARIDGLLIAMVEKSSPGGWGDDPMIGLLKIGNMLLGAAGLLIGVAAISGLAGAGFPLMIAPFMLLLLTSGSLLAFILPMMPFFYWVLAVTGYFLLIAEAIVAVNLWALAHMRMDGDGLSGEAGRQGWLMLLALLMTPVLMVFGFLLGMGIFRVTSALIDIGISQSLAGILGGGYFQKVIGVVIYSLFMSMIYMVLVERSFALVSEFPGRVLRWMGAGAELTNGEENRARAAAVATAGGVMGSGEMAKGALAGSNRGMGLLKNKLLGNNKIGGGTGGGSSGPASGG